MKNLIFLILISLTLFSCANYKAFKASEEQDKIMTMSDEEIKDWSHSNDTIFYKNEPVAYIVNIEYEYMSGIKPRLEISLKQITNPYTFTSYNIEYNLLRYMFTRQPKAKIELKVDHREEK